MAIRCEYTHNSPRLKIDRNPVVDAEIKVFGAGENIVAAAQAAWFFAPSQFGFIWKYNGSIDPFEDTESGLQIWLAKIQYNRNGSQDTANNPFGENSPPDPEFQFDTGGGTQKVFVSRENTAYGTSPPDFNGAIGVKDGKAEGTDIVVPRLKWSETHYYKPEEVGESFLEMLVDASGHVNSNTWRIFDPGEVMFASASGKKQGRMWVPITFNFEASPNVTNLTIGSITGIDKDGWDYLDPYFETKEDGTADALVQDARAVYVHKILPVFDFDNFQLNSNPFTVS